MSCLLVELLVPGKLVAAGIDAVQEGLHHVGRANRMGKARVLRPREHERRQAELAYASQALDLAGVEQRSDDPLRHAIEGDQTVDRVPEDHLATLPPRTQNASVPKRPARGTSNVVPRRTTATVSGCHSGRTGKSWANTSCACR